MKVETFFDTDDRDRVEDRRRQPYIGWFLSIFAAIWFLYSHVEIWFLWFWLSYTYLLTSILGYLPNDPTMASPTEDVEDDPPKSGVKISPSASTDNTAFSISIAASV